MPIFGEFSFARPEWFALLLFLLPIALFWWHAQKKNAIVLRATADYRGAFGSGQLLRFTLLSGIILSIVSLVAIVARPEVSEHSTNVSKNGIDIALVLDLSKSMLAEDMTPNRIGAAKEVIKDFLDRLDGDRVGVVLFAGKPFVSVPLSFDYDGIKTMMDRITTDSIDQNAGPWLQWTAMGDGILTAIRMLDRAQSEAENANEEPRERVIIAMTDGEANVGLDPNIAAKLAREKNIKIHAIGIGKEWTPLVMTDENGEKHPFLDQLGNPLIASLDRDTLQNVANLTDGKTFFASDADSLDQVFATLASLERRSATTETTLSHRSFVWPFVGLLVLSAILSLWAAVLFGRASPIATAVRTYEVQKNPRRIRISLAVVSIGLLILMISPFTLGIGGYSTDDRSILWIIDVSKSMNAVDVAMTSGNQSRLERAKKLVSDAIVAHRGSEQGLAIFAGDSVLASPLSRDTDLLLTFVAGLDTNAVTKGGTDLAGAISLATGNRGESRPSVVAIISDGGDAVDSNAEKLTSDLANAPTTLFVGLGSREGASLPAGYDDAFGSPVYIEHNGEKVVSALNSDLFVQLAKARGVSYEENPDAITLPPSASGASVYVADANWNDERVLLAWFLFPLWLFALFIPDTKRYA